MFRLIIMGGLAVLFKKAWFTLTTQFFKTDFGCLVDREQMTVFEY